LSYGRIELYGMVRYSIFAHGFA